MIIPVEKRPRAGRVRRPSSLAEFEWSASATGLAQTKTDANVASVMTA
jgi:hypothetical protein